MGKKILFISHNAGRTGAPLMLLNVLKWLKQNSNISFEILLRGTGALKDEFTVLAPTYLYQGPGTIPQIPTYIPKFLEPIEYFTKRHHKHLLEKLRTAGIGLVYSNTITNGDILETLSPLNIPTITHVHELDYWIEMMGDKNLEQVLKYSHRYIAASEAVKTNLVNKYAIPSEKINVVHSFIPTEGIKADPSGIRRKLGIPADAFVVLGSGYETWRKGKDLFVQLAALMRQNHSEVNTHFLWVGGWQKGDHFRNIQHDVGHLGLKERVHFIGEVSNPQDYFAAGDVFAMVSREDPFPLVSLESALLGNPILCFADTGGMPEFVEKDAGYIVPYLDLDEMAQKLAFLANNPEIRMRLGKKASEKVFSLYDVASGSRQIEKIVRDCHIPSTVSEEKP